MEAKREDILKYCILDHNEFDSHYQDMLKEAKAGLKDNDKRTKKLLLKHIKEDLVKFLKDKHGCDFIDIEYVGEDVTNAFVTCYCVLCDTEHTLESIRYIQVYFKKDLGLNVRGY